MVFPSLPIRHHSNGKSKKRADTKIKLYETMKLRTLLVSILPVVALARDVTFRVVSMEGTQVGVTVNGATTALTAQNGMPYFTGTVSIADTAGDVKYQYVVDGKAEVSKSPQFLPNYISVNID